MERLVNALNGAPSSRLLVVYGAGVSDRFVLHGCVEVDFETAFWHVLHERGFGRIIFYSYGRGLYFRDIASRDLTRGPEPSAAARPGRRSQPPLGSYRAEAADPQPRSASAVVPESIALAQIDAAMRDTGRRTAVVIVDAQNTMAGLRDVLLFVDRMNTWSGMDSANRNCCFQVLSDVDNTTALQAASTGLTRRAAMPPFNTLVDMLSRASGSPLPAVHVPKPDYDERARIVDLARLQYGIPVRWEDRETLTRQLAAEGLTALTLLQTLAYKAKRFDREALSAFTNLPKDGRTAREHLDDMVGLAQVKAKVKTLVDAAKGRAGRVQATPEVRHMVFTGNPGTGKTTVARLIGEIYRELGTLARGHFTEVSASDLIRGYVGQTGVETAHVFDAALDGVLFIDEIHQLAEATGNTFAGDVVKALVPRLWNEAGRLVVVVAGYGDGVQQFLRMDPGLSRRFPVEYRIHFDDYSVEELLAILRADLKRRGLTCSPEVEVALPGVVDRIYRQRVQDFGNAGDMGLVANSLQLHWDARRGRENLPTDVPLAVVDLGDYVPRPVPEPEEVLARLADMVGLAPVKKAITGIANKLWMDGDAAARKGNWHMVFTGNPGTGKTTVAERMGEIFHALGLLPNSTVRTVVRENLVGGYSGHTASKTSNEVRLAAGGVLFIDEAYTLEQGGKRDFGQEAIDALMQAMDKYAGRLLVVVAGYPEPMQRFLAANPGLDRRFPYHIDFPDYSAEELREILVLQAQDQGHELTLEAQDAAVRYLEAKRAASPTTFGNAGDASTLLLLMTDNLATRAKEAGLTPAAGRALPFRACDVPLAAGAQRPTVPRIHRHFPLVDHLPAPPAGDVTPAQVEAATAYLRCSFADGREGSGTAFLLSPSGLLLTSYHVVEGSPTLGLRLHGAGDTIVPAEVVGFDATADLAVLQAEPAGAPYPWIPLAPAHRVAQKGEELFVYGYPMGSDWSDRDASYADGSVSRVFAEGGERVWKVQLSAPVTHGNSGGPVCRKKDGHVIGVLQGGIDPSVAAGINIAVAVQEVYRHFGPQVRAGEVSANPGGEAQPSQAVPVCAASASPDSVGDGQEPGRASSAPVL